MKSRTIGALAFSSALLLSGCGNEWYSIYNYDGKIDNDNVEFVRRFWLLAKDELDLTVEKPDGRVINYYGDGKRLKLHKVSITQDDVTKSYRNNEVGKLVLEKAQKQFDDYLAKILEIKQNEGLENLE